MRVHALLRSILLGAGVLGCHGARPPASAAPMPTRGLWPLVFRHTGQHPYDPRREPDLQESYRFAWWPVRPPAPRWLVRADARPTGRTVEAWCLSWRGAHLRVLAHERRALGPAQWDSLRVLIDTSVFWRVPRVAWLTLDGDEWYGEAYRAGAGSWAVTGQGAVDGVFAPPARQLLTWVGWPASPAEDSTACHAPGV